MDQYLIDEMIENITPPHVKTVSNLVLANSRGFKTSVRQLILPMYQNSLPFTLIVNNIKGIGRPVSAIYIWKKKYLITKRK